MDNTNKLSLILGVAMLFAIGINGFEKQCYHDGADPADTYTLVLRATFVANTAEQIITLDGTSNNAPSTCKSTSVTVSTVNVNELKIKYGIVTSVQTSPNPSTNDCFVTKSGTTFTVKVAVQKNPGFVQLNDAFYTVTCDTTTVDAGFVAVNPINPASTPTFNTPRVQTDTVTIQLVNVAGTEETTSALGDSVKIRVTYNLDPLAADKEYPIGLHNFDLTVGPQSGDTGRIQLIDNTGCVSPNSNPFALSATYSHKPALSKPTVPGVHVFETGTFTIAMFTGSGQLHFKGYYRKECYDTSDTKCFNQVTQCTSSGRKRRAIENEVNGTYTLNINVRMPGHSNTGQIGASDNDLNTQECTANKTIWILAVVLGAALLFVTMVTLYVFYRFRNEQQRLDKAREKSGFENPTF